MPNHVREYRDFLPDTLKHLVFAGDNYKINPINFNVFNLDTGLLEPLIDQRLEIVNRNNTEQYLSASKLNFEERTQLRNYLEFLRTVLPDNKVLFRAEKISQMNFRSDLIIPEIVDILKKYSVETVNFVEVYTVPEFMLSSVNGFENTGSQFVICYNINLRNKVISKYYYNCGFGPINVVYDYILRGFKTLSQLKEK